MHRIQPSKNARRLWKAEEGNVSPALCLPTALSKLCWGQRSLGRLLKHASAHPREIEDVSQIPTPAYSDTYNRVLECLPQATDCYPPLWVRCFLPGPKFPSEIGEAPLVIPFPCNTKYNFPLERDSAPSPVFPQIGHA